MQVLQDPKIATLSGYIFTTKAPIDNQKKFVKQRYVLATCPRNMVNFGLLAAEICWRVWGTPANFNGFHVTAPTGDTQTSSSAVAEMGDRGHRHNRHGPKRGRASVPPFAEGGSWVLV